MGVDSAVRPQRTRFRNSSKIMHELFWGDRDFSFHQMVTGALTQKSSRNAVYWDFGLNCYQRGVCLAPSPTQASPQVTYRQAPLGPWIEISVPTGRTRHRTLAERLRKQAFITP